MRQAGRNIKSRFFKEVKSVHFLIQNTSFVNLQTGNRKKKKVLHVHTLCACSIKQQNLN